MKTNEIEAGQVVTVDKGMGQGNWKVVRVFPKGEFYGFAEIKALGDVRFPEIKAVEIWRLMPVTE